VNVGSLLYALSSDADRLFSTNNSVHDLLWGYTDPLLTGFNQSFPGIIGNASSLAAAMSDPSVQYDIVGTGENPYANDIRNYHSFQDQTFVDCWETPSANEVRGTDGLQFHSGLTHDDELIAWVDTVYRSTPLQFISEQTFKSITLYRYSLDKRLLLPPSQYPPNADYYMNSPPGVFNISSCAPSKLEIFMSKPHFLNADEYYRNLIHDPTQPDESIHNTFIDVEPLTGTTMHAKKRLQINLHIYPEDRWIGKLFPIQFFPNIQEAFMPVAWIEEGGEVPDDVASDFVSTVYGAQKLSHYLQYGAMIGGEIIIIGGVLLIACGYHRKLKEQNSETTHLLQ